MLEWRRVGQLVEIRWLLVGLLLVGIGQQSIVILRNPFLLDQGWSEELIPTVQGAGAVAGVLAGLVALAFAGRIRPAYLLAAASILQAIGICLQVISPSRASVLVGAVVGGIPMRFFPAIAPPLLRSVTSEPERLSAFAAYATALTPLAGLSASVLIVAITLGLGEGLIGQKLALLFAAVLSVLAALPFLRIKHPPVPANAAWRLHAPRRLMPCLVIETVIAIGAGISIPFMQLFFKVTFGAGPQAVATIYLLTMVTGLLGFLVGPTLARRFGLWQTIVGTGLLSMPLLIELTLTRSLFVAATAFAVRHMLMNMSGPLVQSFYQEIAEEGDGPIIAALAVLIRSSAGAVGSFLAVPMLIVGEGSFSAALMATTGLYAVGSLASAAFYPRLWRSRRSVSMASALR